jgi:hypothetical protein
MMEIGSQGVTGERNQKPLRSDDIFDDTKRLQGSGLGAEEADLNKLLKMIGSSGRT